MFQDFWQALSENFLENSNLRYQKIVLPRVFDGADLTAANKNSKFLFFTQLKGGRGLGL